MARRAPAGRRRRARQAPWGTQGREAAASLDTSLAMALGDLGCLATRELDLEPIRCELERRIEADRHTRRVAQGSVRTGRSEDARDVLRPRQMIDRALRARGSV